MKMMKRLCAAFFAAAVIVSGAFAPMQTLAAEESSQPASVSQSGAADVFYDDFNGDSLNRNDWLIACKAWGNGNGGVVPENVSVSDGKLILTAHGDSYTGSLRGVDRCGNRVSRTTRVGAAVATREYYSSGSYEMRAKIAPELGACSAMWSFEYEETPSGAITNHEIDIELPGRPGSSLANIGFDYALFSTYQTESAYTLYTKLDTALNDHQFHTYRYDWHTGDDGETARVEFYIDDVLKGVSYKRIPTNAGRLWLGVWFPDRWAGTPDFDTTCMEIDYVKITPFHEAGDTPENETYARDGWAPDTSWDVSGNQPGTGEPGQSEVNEPEQPGADTPEQPGSGKPEQPETNESEQPGLDIPAGENLLLNGDFASDAAGWKLTGSARVENGKAVLASGSDTDEIIQQVSVDPATSYKLLASVASPGAEVQIGVKDHQGRYTSYYETANQNGLVEFVFTTAAHVNSVAVEGKVLRYQSCREDCSIDWMYLTRDLNYEPGQSDNSTQPEESVQPDSPSQSEEPGEPDNLTQPEEPVQSDNPTQPEEPVQPDNPSQSEEPGQSDNLTQPEEPVQSDNPTQPEEPGQSDNPSQSEELGQPASASENFVFGSDRHGQSVTSILTSIAGALNGETVEFVGLAGDMPNNVDSYLTSSLVNEIRAGGSAYSQSVIGLSYGNHDSNGTDDAGIMLSSRRGSGLYTVGDDYAVYMISQTDMKTAEDAARSAAAFASVMADPSMDGKMIFVMSHLPLHDRRNDNDGALVWMDALNQAAQSKEIVFLWGHNHSGETYKDRDVFLIPKGGSICPEDGIQTAINFTYVNAGYIGGSETDRADYMTLITASDESLTFRGFTSNGAYTGALNTDCTIMRTDGFTADPLAPSVENRNLITNGTFENGAYAWTTSGGTVIANERAQLASGSNTDTLKQIVDVEPNTTYTLQADVVSEGTEITVGVKNQAGKYTSESVALSSTGAAVVTFTTGSGIESIEVFANVLRYQGTSDTVLLDNVILVKGTEIPDEPDQPSQPEQPGEPSQPDEPDEPSQSDQPGEPELPSQPDQPDEPDEPSQPDQPGEPEQPSQPDQPDEPDQPSELEQPGEPELLSQPDQSGEPDEPSQSDQPDEPDQPSEPETPSAAVNELLLNHSFDAGSENWQTSGSTRFSAGCALLASGKDTDTLKQYVDLEANTTYTVTAGFLTEGAEIELIVGGYDGKYSSISEGYTASGEGSITFTTGNHAASVKIAMQVLRYQGNSSDCVVQEISLVQAA